MVVLFAGCNFDFLTDSDDDSSSDGDDSYYETDSTLDTRSYYESDGTLVWTEYYDFDTEGNCIFIKRVLASETVLWSKVYSWDGDNLDLEAYYDDDNNLSWYKQTVWDGDNALQYIEYDGSDNLQGYETWTYNGDDTVATAAGYDENEDLEWAYSYTYDSSGNRTEISVYDAAQARTAIVASEYDDDDRLTQETGYGDSSWDSSYESSYSETCFEVSYGGINTEDRNTDLLTVPTAPTAPVITTLTLGSGDLDYAWLFLKIYDDYGYTSATLNEDYYPVSLSRYAPDYLDGILQLEMDFSGDQLNSKEITYDGESILALAFDFDSLGRLTYLETSGEALLLPLDYSVTYYDSGVPESLTIATSGVDLQTLTFDYGTIDLDTLSFDTYLENIATIHQYDGDDEYVAYYVFTYGTPDTEGSYALTLTVYDAQGTEDDSDDVENGTIVLEYDADDFLASLSSFDSDGNSYWAYEYGYTDLVEDVTSAVEDASDTLRILTGESYFDEDDLPSVSDYSSEIDMILDLITDLDMSKYL
ncbi:MAG: hypothetical protein PQJ60_09160, partial [Spirochaetales bacterium]|nr:hypothetical protein [Spirochaetales bacterium]